MRKLQLLNPLTIATNQPLAATYSIDGDMLSKADNPSYFLSSTPHAGVSPTHPNHPTTTCPGPERPPQTASGKKCEILQLERMVNNDNLMPNL